MASPSHTRPTTPAQAIDRDSIVPFYHQLKVILLRRIEVDRLGEGDRFWSEKDLCETYGVARSVVRQAVLELEQARVVYRIKGRGTYLAPSKVDHGLTLSLDGLFEHARRLGLRRAPFHPRPKHAGWDSTTASSPSSSKGCAVSTGRHGLTPRHG
ncbi:GntR family transcriptional regulator [Actinomycetaceae bacterium L2_0104]